MNSVIPHIDIEINEDRIIPSAEVGIAVAGLILGMASGITEGLCVLAALGILGSGIGLELTAYTGQLTEVYTNPWIKIHINGYLVYPPGL